MFEEKREALMAIEAAVTSVAAEPDHAAATIPKLYVMIVNQALGFDSGFNIVRAAQGHTPCDVPYPRQGYRPDIPTTGY
jgi:hypothetical protein